MKPSVSVFSFFVNLVLGPPRGHCFHFQQIRSFFVRRWNLRFQWIVLVSAWSLGSGLAPDMWKNNKQGCLEIPRFLMYKQIYFSVLFYDSIVDLVPWNRYVFERPVFYLAQCFCCRNLWQGSALIGGPVRLLRGVRFCRASRGRLWTEFHHASPSIPCVIYHIPFTNCFFLFITY